METLLTIGDYPYFLIEFEDNGFTHSCTFKVYEVSSWNMEDNTPSETELYLKGYVKFDGCSHIWFGGEDRDGYLHLCGKFYWDNHKKVMDAIWQKCSERIDGFVEE